MNLFGETHLVLKGIFIITQQSCLHIAMKNYSDRNSINKPVINHYHNDLNQPAELFDVCSTLRIKMKIWVWSLSSSIRICGLLVSSYKWPEVTLNGHRAIHPPTPGGLYASPCLLYWFPQKLKRVFLGGIQEERCAISLIQNHQKYFPSSSSWIFSGHENLSNKILSKRIIFTIKFLRDERKGGDTKTSKLRA